MSIRPSFRKTFGRKQCVIGLHIIMNIRMEITKQQYSNFSFGVVYHRLYDCIYASS